MFRSGRPVINEQIAKLSNVKTLGFLWQEYVSGIKGYKPASKFTSNERGKVKITYCRHKVFMVMINRQFQVLHNMQKDRLNRAR